MNGKGEAMGRLTSFLSLVVLVALPAPGCTTGTQPVEPPQVADEGTDEPVPPGEIWNFRTGGEVWSSPVIRAGSIILGSDDGNIYSVDRASGEQNWEFPTGDRVRSRGAICDDKALFAGDDGYLYALDAGSGAEVWKFDLGSAGISRRLPDPEPPYDYDYLTSSPVCSAGTVYAGSADGHLYAVDGTTGAVKWQFKTGGKVRSTPLVHQAYVYIGSWDHHLYALDAGSGEEVWKFDTGGIVQASPAHGDGKIFIGSRNPVVFALDAGTGTPIWEYVHEDGSWVESSAVFVNGMVYVGSSDALKLQALDPATGIPVWEYRVGGWAWCTPLVDKDMVFIGAISAYPYYFEDVILQRGLHAVDRRTGVKRWIIDTAELSGSYVTGGVHATPVIADGVIYVGALDGNLYALQQ